MSQDLTTQHNNNLLPLAPSLEPQERELILAKNGDRMRDMKPEDLRDKLIVLIGQVYVECGQVPNEGTLRLSLPALLDDMIKYFGTLTFSEVQKAWKLGVMKEFGDWFGLNNVTFLNWTKSYLGWTKRLEACKKQNAFDKEQNKPVEKTQEEKDKIMMEGLLAGFQYVKETKKTFPDLGGVNYAMLDRMGLIPFNPERKRKMVGLAMDKIRGELVNEITKTPSKRKELQEEMMNLDHTSDRVKTEAKRIALNTFFMELIEVGQELKDLLVK